jgi:hypothetical protein
MTLVGGVLRAARALRLATRAEPPDSRPTRIAGPALPVGRDPDGLTRWQADHAGYQLAAMRPADQEPVQRALWAARPDARPHLRRAVAAGHRPARVLELANALRRATPEWSAQRLRLLDAGETAQRRLGARIDQVDQRTCGTTVLLVLAAQADPVLAAELTAPDHDRSGSGFGRRFDRRQRAVHRQSNRLWPRALGTSPWGMTRWLRRHAAGVGPYRVRLVDDADPRDLAATMAATDAALDLGDPVPLLVGNRLPRHYVLAIGRHAAGWRVFEPTAGEVRTVPAEAVTGHRLGPLLGFDRLHAVLLPG